MTGLGKILSFGLIITPLESESFYDWLLAWQFLLNQIILVCVCVCVYAYVYQHTVVVVAGVLRVCLKMCSLESNHCFCF